MLSPPSVSECVHEWQDVWQWLWSALSGHWLKKRCRNADHLPFKRPWVYHVKKGQNSIHPNAWTSVPFFTQNPLGGEEAQTDQLVGHLVHDVWVVQPPPLVLPPAFDVDAGLLLKVGQVEVVPAVYNHQIGYESTQWKQSIGKNSPKAMHTMDIN